MGKNLMNPCEAEIDAIRLKLHEKTKHMTPEEHTRWSNERGYRLAAQYGFTIVKSANDTTTQAAEKLARA